MASLQITRAVAHIEAKVKKGEKVIYGEVMSKSGYSKATSKHPEKLTGTKTYRKLAIPLIAGLQEEITRVKDAMGKKDLSKEEYRVLIGSFDILTKNYQLLSGGATERQVFVVPSEILDKNALITSKENTKRLNNGSS